MKDRGPTPAVLAINQISFQGHIIPRSWYQTITRKTPSGRTSSDLLAINILSEIVYWYRPKPIVDESTGKTIGLERKFAADKLQRSYQALADYFGVRKRAASEACHRLQDAGLITLELRAININGLAINNVLFIEPVPEAIRAATFPPSITEIGYPYHEKQGEGVRKTGGGGTKNRDANTESTSESTSETIAEKNTFSKIVSDDKPSGMDPCTIEDKPDCLDMLVAFSGKERAAEWTVPAAAGGASDWAAAVDAFAILCGVDPDLVCGKKRREWSRVLEKVGVDNDIGPGVLEYVIGQVPESEFNWKTYSTPHQARDDLAVLAGQHLTGGIRAPKERKNQAHGISPRLLAMATREEGPVIEGRMMEVF